MTIDLEAIKARAAAATEGPWLANATDDETACVVDSGFISIADCEDDTEDGYRNAEFIAAARADVPALLAEVERLRAIVEAIEKVHRRGVILPQDGRPARYVCDTCSDIAGTWEPWECPTIAALSSPSGPVVVSGGTE